MKLRSVGSGLCKSEQLQGHSSTSLGQRAFMVHGSQTCPQICHLCFGPGCRDGAKPCLCSACASVAMLSAHLQLASTDTCSRNGPASRLLRSSTPAPPTPRTCKCWHGEEDNAGPYRHVFHIASHVSYHLCRLMQCNQQFNMLLLNMLIILFLSDTAITRFLCFDAESSKTLN